MLIYLSANQKLGFINGKHHKARATDALYNAWIMCKDMVIAWILNNLDKDIAEIIFTLKLLNKFSTRLKTNMSF